MSHRHRPLTPLSPSVARQPLRASSASPIKHLLHRSQHVLCRPLALSVYLAILGSAWGADWMPEAQVQQTQTQTQAQITDTQKRATSSKTYNIPGGALSITLNRFVEEAGALLSVPADITQGKSSPGVQGRHTLQSGFVVLLAGTGLVALPQTDGSFSLRPIMEVGERGNTTLPTVHVSAKSDLRAYSNSFPVSAATRTAIAQQDLPQTLDVVSQASLRDRAANSLKDALIYTPGVTTSTGEGTREHFNIRGFSAIADTYIDGMRDGANLFRDTYNLEQIEVVKGPAGVLLGRGSAGGVINMVSKRPTMTPRIELGVSGGSHELRRGTVDVNRPINEKLLFRVNAMEENAASYRDWVWSKKRGATLATTLKITPATQLDLRFSHAMDERVLDAGIPGIYGKPADVPRSTYYGAKNPGTYDRGSSEDNILAADLSVQLNDTLQLRNTLSYRDLTLDRHQTTIKKLVLNGSQPPLVDLQRNSFVQKQQGVTNKLELIASGRLSGIEHELMVGTEISEERRDSVSRGADLKAVNRLTVYDPVLKDVPWEVANFRRNGIYNTQTQSLYLQDLLRFNEHWVVLAGIRKDWLNRDFSNRSGPDYGHKDDFFSPRLGVVFQPNKIMSYYVSATRSYQPGSDTGVIDPGNSIQPPEIATNYEIGSKWALADGKLQLTASVFRLIKENVPSRDPSDATKNIYIGEITASGVEFSALGDLGYGFSLQGGLAYIDTEISKTNDTTTPAILPRPAPIPLQGKRSANAPPFSANLWSVKKLDHAWRVGLGLRHVGQRYTSTTNTVVLPAYTLLDSGAFYDDGPWSLALTLRNVTGQKYYESSTNDLGILPGAPTSLLMTARYSF